MSAVRGRGAADNPTGRFETIRVEPDDEAWAFDDEDERPAPRTQFIRDSSKSIITYNDSPDVGFDASVNPYRGCEHGCIYCYARPYHEYLGFSAGLDFETKILVKEDAPELLRRELLSPTWRPQVVGLSGVTDPYQPIERKLQITRRCLEVFAEFRNPVTIVTKNHLVTRDVDVLQALARHDAVSVNISITTLDAELARVMEPRTATIRRRLDAIRLLADAGVPVGVMTAPVIPGLTDHEIPTLIEAAVENGAHFAGYTALRLPMGVGPLFEQWLAEHVPNRKDKVLNRLRAMRDGRLNDTDFGKRMRGEGVFAEQIRSMFELACRRTGILGRHPDLSTAGFRLATPGQLLLFDQV